MRPRLVLFGFTLLLLLTAAVLTGGVAVLADGPIRPEHLGL
jgi:hypothetical protein